MKKENPLQEYHLALGLHQQGKLDEALLKYKKAVRLKPDHLEAHAKIADILIVQNKIDEVELRYKRILALRPDQADVHYNLGMALQKLDKLDEAVASYQKAIALKSRYAFTAMSNIGIIFSEQDKLDAAGEMFQQALALNPDSPFAHYNLALHFRKRGDIKNALSQYIKVLVLNPDMAEAHAGLRSILSLPGVEYVQVIDMLEEHSGSALLAERLYLLHCICAWDRTGGLEPQLLEKVRANLSATCPFFILRAGATAQDLLECARLFNHRDVSGVAPYAYPVKKPGERIRIGYISSDLQEHPISYLMADLFEQHDRARFNVIAYSHGADDGGVMRKRLAGVFDEFVDIQHLSDAAAADRIHRDGIDILIDLNGGATGNARMGILARRPSPVQVNYLGYPGTTGVNYIDYIIADAFIIPPNQEQFYSEKVVCLPDCYQPNDRQRQIAETPARAACGLPERGFVFCGFHATYKITPEIFDIWMRLLQQVPGSVLWLLESNRPAKENLQREAIKRGIDAGRLIFASKAPQAEHLARQQLADLFLDIVPINAHTTTSDALWAGLPVLTCVGTTFAARVAGSLLTAAELPELITYSLEEYEALALKLAQNPAQLSALRQKLQQTQLRVPLFDIEKYTRNLEMAYQGMWNIHVSGEKPRAITV